MLNGCKDFGCLYWDWTSIRGRGSVINILELDLQLISLTLRWNRDGILGIGPLVKILVEPIIPYWIIFFVFLDLSTKLTRNIMST